jgi:hypothetical protein
MSVVTAARFAKGMTFDEYVKWAGSPENLAREAFGSYHPDAGSIGGPRKDNSAVFRERYARLRLADHQAAAIKWLAAQPGGPAHVLVISEDWSSDCRRDVPMLARVAAVTGMEMRIFRRDGQRFSDSHVPSLSEAPDSNADLMSQFLNHKNGETWQSIPVAAFFDKDMKYLYHYTEYPAIYEKDRVAGFIRTARPGEPAGEAMERGARDFQSLQDGPFFRIWASAGVDEIISALHRKVLLGEV